MAKKQQDTQKVVIKTYGKALVCLGLIISATLLEMNGYKASGIWFLIVVWILFGSF